MVVRRTCWPLFPEKICCENYEQCAPALRRDVDPEKEHFVEPPGQDGGAGQVAGPDRFNAVRNDHGARGQKSAVRDRALVFGPGTVMRPTR